MEIIQFSLTQEYIQLIKLLKLLNLCESGADAKIAVESNLVYFNNVVETQKRKKLRKGDTIKFYDTLVKIV